MKIDWELAAIAAVSTLAVIHLGLYLVAVMGLVAPLVYLLITGDFPGAQVFYGLQEDDAIVTCLLNIR